MTERQKDFLSRAIIKQEKYETISKEMKVDRKELSKWWDELKEEREQLSAIRRLWRTKINSSGEIDESFESFRKWYLTTERQCHYCEITEEQINQLWKKDSNLTKRKRGKNLEIDRKKPNDSYEDTRNLVYSCYWCNNAKTDTFCEEEFLEIGKSIKKVWEKRLQS